MAKQTGNKANKLNIYNIASEAGVSIATVSRVLNDSPSVSAKTKEKVLSVIANCNYVPSAIAQNLSTRTSGNLIGIVCYNLKDIYYATAVSLLESALRKRGHHIILSCTGEDYMQKQKSIEMLITKQVDAVILIGSVFLDEYGNNAYLVNAAKHCPLRKRDMDVFARRYLDGRAPLLSGNGGGRQKQIRRDPHDDRRDRFFRHDARVHGIRREG